VCIVYSAIIVCCVHCNARMWIPLPVEHVPLCPVTFYLGVVVVCILLLLLLLFLFCCCTTTLQNTTRHLDSTAHHTTGVQIPHLRFTYSHVTTCTSVYYVRWVVWLRCYVTFTFTVPLLHTFTLRSPPPYVAGVDCVCTLPRLHFRSRTTFGFVHLFYGFWILHTVLRMDYAFCMVCAIHTALRSAPGLLRLLRSTLPFSLRLRFTFTLRYTVSLVSLRYRLVRFVVARSPPPHTDFARFAHAPTAFPHCVARTARFTVLHAFAFHLRTTCHCTCTPHLHCLHGCVWFTTTFWIRTSTTVPGLLRGCRSWIGLDFALFRLARAFTRFLAPGSYPPTRFCGCTPPATYWLHVLRLRLLPHCAVVAVSWIVHHASGFGSRIFFHYTPRVPTRCFGLLDSPSGCGCYTLMIYCYLMI